MDIHDLQLPEHHRETARRFVAVCQADPRIVAAFLGGSYPTPESRQIDSLTLISTL